MNHNGLSINEIISHLLTFLESHSAFLIISILILPVFGFPVTALYVLVGVVFGLKIGLLLCIISIIINILISSILYKSALNAFFLKKFSLFLNSFNSNLVEKIGQTQFILAVKLIPTFPFIVQNYILLTTNNISLLKILILSTLTDGIWAYCCIAGGNSIKHGQIGLLTLLSITTLIILSKLIYNMFYKKHENKGNGP